MATEKPILPDAADPINRIVKMDGEEFVLDEPSTDIVIRILNAIGSVAVRAEGTVARIIRNPTNRAVILGVLAVISKEDLIRLGSAVLQFDDDTKGRKWLKEHELKVAPIVDAVMINLALSEDLTEAMSSFFGGIDNVAEMIERIMGAIVPPTTEDEEKTEPTDEPESGGEPPGSNP